MKHIVVKLGSLRVISDGVATASAVLPESVTTFRRS